jgi:hypothetical protein
VPEPVASGREMAFAALALLRCRDRMAAVLAAVAEPRRSELAAALAELERSDEAHLKLTLANIIRREDEALLQNVARSLGDQMPKAPRVVRQWLARGARR